MSPAARPVIGLVGQVCAGKSTVAESFRRRGAAVYEADKLVHALYRREDVKQDVRARFGAEMFGADGEVDRSKLGARVFADPAKLKELTEQVIFPRTRVELMRQLDAFRAASGPNAAPALLLDAPTLLEAGYTQLCDKLLFLSAPKARREAWAQARNGWSAEELARRDARLGDETAKRARCDEVLENAGSVAELDEKIGRLWKRWVSGLPAAQD